MSVDTALIEIHIVVKVHFGWGCRFELILANYCTLAMLLEHFTYKKLATSTVFLSKTQHGVLTCKYVVLYK